MSRLNLKAEDKTQEYILAYLEENASDSLVERINAGKKTLSGCLSYLSDWARKELKPKGGVAGAPDEVVFGQAIHYFEEDSLDFEKKAPVAAAAVAPAPSAPVKAKGRGKGKAKVAVASVPVDAAKVSSTVDELLADCGIAVAEEKPAEPEPEAPPAPAERKEPEQMDWLKEFGIGV
jgi:hypothetical protein